VSKILEQVIERLYPEEVSKIAAEEAAARLEGPADGPRDIPLFVMSAVLPCEIMALNIFEPRYRLLVRRAMEGRRRFGMVGLNGESPQPIMTEVEVERCVTQPDGRYHIQVRGLQRYTYESIGYQDDYAVAKNVAPYEDEDADADEQQIAALENELDEKLGRTVSSLGGQTLQDLYGYPGQTARDARAKCWMAAGVLTLVSPRPYLVHRFKYEMLQERSLQKRLTEVCRLFTALDV